jgi:CheY-like chemotaxis protein
MSGLRARVLVVDDEEAIVRLVTRELRRFYDVETAVNGARALELVRAAPFDVIVSDLMMPVMSGDELHRHIAAASAEQAARMIFITGASVRPDLRAFLDSVPNPHLEKPFTLAGLTAVVRSVLAGVRPSK